MDSKCTLEQTTAQTTLIQNWLVMGFMSFRKTIKLLSFLDLYDVPLSCGETIKEHLFSLQVESPLAVDAVLGESPFSVTDDKVSITELRVHAISGLTLSLQPSPGNSHTMVAKATGLQTLTTPKQVQHDLWHRAEKRNYRS